MPTATFSEAAAMMGWRSRSTLYRLRDEGRLQKYLRPGPHGREVLELEPQDAPPLRDYLRQSVRIQAGSPLHERPQRRRHQPPDPLEVAARETARLRAELAAALQREAGWISAYHEVREWIIGAVPDGFTFTLLSELPDPAPIGDVMVLARRLMLEHLRAVDAADLASRSARRR